MTRGAPSLPPPSRASDEGYLSSTLPRKRFLDRSPRFGELPREIASTTALLIRLPCAQNARSDRPCGAGACGTVRLPAVCRAAPTCSAVRHQGQCTSSTNCPSRSAATRRHSIPTNCAWTHACDHHASPHPAMKTSSSHPASSPTMTTSPRLQRLSGSPRL